MSDATRQPIRFLLSDMDGTLLLPDHSLSSRTLCAVRALRGAGVYFSLATGRPPRAMLAQIKSLGVDLPTAAFNGGTIGPWGSRKNHSPSANTQTSTSGCVENSSMVVRATSTGR